MINALFSGGIVSRPTISLHILGKILSASREVCYPYPDQPFQHSLPELSRDRCDFYVSGSRVFSACSRYSRHAQDILGMLKNITILARQAEEALTSGIGFYGSCSLSSYIWRFSGGRSPAPRHVTVPRSTTPGMGSGLAFMGLSPALPPIRGGRGGQRPGGVGDADRWGKVSQSQAIVAFTYGCWRYTSRIKIL